MKRIPPFLSLSLSLSSALLLGGWVMSDTNPAIAAEQLVVTYGALQASFEVADLETLAQTGELPDSLGFYLDLANLAPEDLRTILTTEVTVSHAMLDDLLNSEGGEYMLSEITQVIHTPSQQANIQALRSALVLAASDDQRITLLELFQKYPTQQIYVDGPNLMQLAQDLTGDQVAEGTPEP